nr:N-acetylmuramoyl-L-alanine amidase [Frankia sp. QA3]
MATPILGLIPHVQVGTGSLFSWFNNPASKVSAHLWLSRTGAIEQYVPFDRRAWAEAAGNPYWISCECEGYDTEDYTPIQIVRLAELFRWGMHEFGWEPRITDSPARGGLGTHRMGGALWGGHSCPGDIRANRRRDILARAVSAPPPTDRCERFVGRPTLRSNAVGSNVTDLQQALNIVFAGAGAGVGHLDPDGRYGPRTTAQVAALQRYVSPWFGRIDDDGVCGPATWQKLGHVLTGLETAA